MYALEKQGVFGAEGQNRTDDTSIFSAVLYRLSYLGVADESIDDSLEKRKPGLAKYRVAEALGATGRVAVLLAIWLELTETVGGGVSLKVGPIDVVPAGNQLVAQIQKHKVSDIAAELAFWFFLALFPFLIFVAALSSFLASMLGLPTATGAVIGLLDQVMPSSAARLLGPQVAAVVGNQSLGLLSIGVIGVIWAASGGLMGVIRATNSAYEVEETRSFLEVRGLAIGLTILGGFVIVAAFALFFLGELLGSRIAAALGLAGPFAILLAILYWGGAFLLVFLAAAFLYWQAPNVRVPFRGNLPGALFFSVAWILATWIFALYVSHFGSYNATYGALGGLAIALLWFHLTGFVLIVGAEINVVVDKQTHRQFLHNSRVNSEQEAQRPARSA